MTKWVTGPRSWPQHAPFSCYANGVLVTCQAAHVTARNMSRWCSDTACAGHGRSKNGKPWLISQRGQPQGRPADSVQAKCGPRACAAARVAGTAHDRSEHGRWVWLKRAAGTELSPCRRTRSRRPCRRRGRTCRRSRLRDRRTRRLRRRGCRPTRRASRCRSNRRRAGRRARRHL